MNRSTWGLPVHHQLLEFTQTHVHPVGDQPDISSSVFPFSSCPQSFPASRSFQWVNSLHEVAKVLEFQPQHQSFHNEHPGLIFRMDCLDLLVVQGTLKSLFQNHSWKASILRCSAFFIVQLSHPYILWWMLNKEYLFLDICIKLLESAPMKLIFPTLFPQ